MNIKRKLSPLLFSVFAVFFITSCLVIFTSCKSNDSNWKIHYYVKFVDEQWGMWTSDEHTNQEENNHVELWDEYLPFGYKIEGLYTELEGGGTKVFDEDGRQLDGTRIKDGHFLYAHYVPVKFNFVFMRTDDCKTYVADKAVEYTYHTDLTADAFPENRSLYGKRFVGWAKDKDGTAYYLKNGEVINPYFDDVNYDIQDNVSVPVSPTLNQTMQAVCLYPVYEDIYFTLTLDYQRPSISAESIPVLYGENVSDFSAYDRIDGNYCIMGWSTKKTELEPFDGGMLQDMTLYAIWAEFRTVDFVYGEADTRSERVYFIDDAWLLPNPTAVPGKALEGWHIASDLTDAAVSNVAYGDLESVYYAKWTNATYSVTFHTEYGVTPAPISYEYGVGAPLPKSAFIKLPTQAIEGWYDNPSFEGEIYSAIPSNAWGNLDLYAKWTTSKAIATKADLLAIDGELKTAYHLTNDINMDGDGFSIPLLNGTLNGNGFKIYNMALTENNLSLETNEISCGFIQLNKGTVKNLTLEGVTLSFVNVNFGGALVGYNEWGNIINCHVVNSNANVTYKTKYTTALGGWLAFGNICGRNNGTIRDCTTKNVTTGITVQNEHYSPAGHPDRQIGQSVAVASLCGWNLSYIYNSSAYADKVTTNAQVSSIRGGVNAGEFSGLYVYAGLLCGRASGGIVRSSAAGEVSTSLKRVNPEEDKGTSQHLILTGATGLLVGYSDSDRRDIEQCFVCDYNGKNSKATMSFDLNESYFGSGRSEISKESGVGGFIGINSSKIKNCYVQYADVYANQCSGGGFVGYNKNDIKTSYAALSTVSDLNAVSAQHLGGFVGDSSSLGTVSGSWADVDVFAIDGTYAHLFAGQIHANEIVNCYYFVGGEITVGGSLVEETISAVTGEEIATLLSPSFLKGLYWNDGIWNMLSPTEHTLFFPSLFLKHKV